MKNQIKKGDRYTNHLGKICIVKSVYGNILKLQIIDDDDGDDGNNNEYYSETWTIEDFTKNKSFFKIPMPKIDRTNISKYLLEYQLNMVGKTLHQSKSTPNWINTWTITPEEFKFFEMYAIPLLKKTFKINTTKAREIFDWFNLQFGLKIKIKQWKKQD